MTVASFGVLMEAIPVVMSSFLLIIRKGCATVHDKPTILMFKIRPRCDRILLNCPVGESEEYITCLNLSSFDFIYVLVQDF